MIGRGVFGRPDFFNENSHQGNSLNLQKGISLMAKIDILKQHIKIFDEKLLQTGDKNFDVMKKHYKSYTTNNGASHSKHGDGHGGPEGMKELRLRLMKAQNAGEVRKIVQDFLKNL